MSGDSLTPGATSPARTASPTTRQDIYSPPRAPPFFAWQSLFASNATGINGASDGIYDGDPAQSGRQPLGTFTIQANDLNKTVSFRSPALLDYLQASPNGDITLLITRQTDSGSLNTSFASKESTTLRGPRLLVNSSESLAPSDDATIRADNTGPYGTNQNLTVKGISLNLFPPDLGTFQSSLVEFTVDTNRAVREASLALTVTGGNAGPNVRFTVFGLKDGASGEDFDDNTLRYSDVTADLEKLATFTLPSTAAGQRIVISSTALNDFINASTNNKVSLLISHQEINGKQAQFASSEHPTFQPPALRVKYAHDDAPGADAELTFVDIDHNAIPELVLLISHPGSGGEFTANPFVIAEMVRALGYSMGSGTTFWDSLSPTQRDFLLLVTGYMSGAANDGIVTGSELEQLFSYFVGAREYPLSPFASAPARDLGALSSSLTLDAAIATIESAAAVSQPTIDTAHSAVLISAHGLAVGSERTVFALSHAARAATSLGASPNLSDDLWSAAASLRAASAGLDARLSLDPINADLALFLEDDAAQDLWDDLRSAVHSGQQQFTAWLQGGFTDSMLWLGHAGLTTTDFLKDTAISAQVWTKNTSTLAVIWVREKATEVGLQFYGTASEMALRMKDCLLGMVSFYASAAYALEDFGQDIGDDVLAAYDSAEGWTVGTANSVATFFEDDVANGAQDLADDTADVVEDVIDYCGCVCRNSCF